jgi:hypothetical protein
MPLSQQESELLQSLKAEVARRMQSSNEVAKGEANGTIKIASNNGANTLQSGVRKYIITDPETGRKIRLTRDTLPTEQELEEIFKNLPSPKSKKGETDAGLTQELTFVTDEIQQSNTHEFDPSKPFWLVSIPPGFKELINEPAQGLILFSPSGRRFQWTNSAALTQTDIEQLGRLETEQADLIKNRPEIRSLLNRNPNDFYPTGWVVLLLAFFAVSWILARRRYNRQPGEIRTTNQEAVSNRASFRRASLGVRRLASTLFWLFTIGCISAGIVSGGSDFRFLVSVGLIMGLFSWVLIRGIDWIVRGFKFGGYDIDGKS